VKIILGISAFYHDSAAALIENGKIVAAAQEERFSRVKHDSSFPKNAIKFILDFKKITISQIDAIVFYEKPFLKFERLLETYVACAPKGFKQFSRAMPAWVKDKLFQKNQIIKFLYSIDKTFIDEKKILFSEHHLSHAASAFYPSPFNEAIILTADGVGEWATTTVAIGKNRNLEIVKEINFPHSLGLLYSSFTYYIGFKVNSGEYKLMGLAPYGKPIYADIIKKELVSIKKDGSFWLNQKYFDYMTGLKMINNEFENLFGRKTRNPLKDKIEQFHMDIASSIQKVTEEILIKILINLKEEYKVNNLCLAGGVALNCVANGKILKEKIFKNIWVQPAAGDAGGSLGAALAYWNLECVTEQSITKKDYDDMQGSYLGPEFNDDIIERKLDKIGAKFQKLDYNNLLEKTAKLISEGNVIGWFQGRMEFGPRSLGSRSILADPRSFEMQKKLNLKIKFRESFRPFAPAILEEDLCNWFDLKEPSPYMLQVSQIKEHLKINITEDANTFGIDKLNLKRSKIPAVTHVDFSARIQTVNKDTNSKFYDLISKFKNLTGCPILINTSFNVRGEPIVCNPEDAFRCFVGTNMDVLVIGSYLLKKSEQKIFLNKDYHKEFDLD